MRSLLHVQIRLVGSWLFEQALFSGNVGELHATLDGHYCKAERLTRILWRWRCTSAIVIQLIMRGPEFGVILKPSALLRSGHD